MIPDGRSPRVATMSSLQWLYVTVTSLTTTGDGDIALSGTPGRLISVVVMLCGVTLLLRSAQVLFRPNEVRHPRPAAPCSATS